MQTMMLDTQWRQRCNSARVGVAQFPTCRKTEKQDARMGANCDAPYIPNNWRALHVAKYARSLARTKSQTAPCTEHRTNLFYMVACATYIFSAGALSKRNCGINVPALLTSSPS